MAIRTSVGENHLSYQQLTEMGITETAVGHMIEAAPCAWVAEENGVITGFAIADKETASLFALFVRPEFEGQGFGHALLKAAEGYLFHFCEKIRLVTAAGTRAQMFYQKLGWHIVTIDETNDLHMEKICLKTGKQDIVP